MQLKVQLNDVVDRNRAIHQTGILTLRIAIYLELHSTAREKQTYHIPEKMSLKVQLARKAHIYVQHMDIAAQRGPGGREREFTSPKNRRPT
jgi:hypothetical protein